MVDVNNVEAMTTIIRELAYSKLKKGRWIRRRSFTVTDTGSNCARPDMWSCAGIPGWSAFLSNSFCGSFQFATFPLLSWAVQLSFQIHFVFSLSLCTYFGVELSSILENRFHTRSELVSFPFKFPVWKLPIWNPSSPELVSFPFKFPVWKLPIWNPSSPELVSFPFKFPVWKLPI